MYVKANIAKAQTKQIAFDLKRHGKTDPKSQVAGGDIVLLKNKREESRKGGKLNTRYLEPYKVESIYLKKYR